jgi:hypothetical protein
MVDMELWLGNTASYSGNEIKHYVCVYVHIYIYMQNMVEIMTLS